MPDRDTAAESTGVTYRPDIQGLRAIAVALVVLAHAGATWFEGGFIGVDVFFVLSGYLITGLLLEERLATGRIGYGRFVARRLRRLLPAMLTMLLLTLFFAVIILTAFEMRMQSRSFPFAAAWISNFFFAFAERDYFQALQDEDLFLHTWSLGVEEQFYLFWPWLVLVFSGMRVKAAGRLALGQNVVAAFTIVGVASLALSLYLTKVFPILAFYMMPSRIWQFALGAIVYVGVHVARSPETAGSGSAIPVVAGIAGLLLVLGSGAWLGPDLMYPGWYALLPSFGTALILAAGAIEPRAGVAAVLRSRPFVWVGDRSYSIYLWHWPILLLGNVVGMSRTVAGIVTLVALSVLIADASYRFVEFPFWKGRFRNAMPRQVVLNALAAVIVCATAYYMLERQVFGATVPESVIASYDPRQDVDRRVYSALLSCDQGRFGTDIVPCPLGNPEAPRLAVLVGDSIGAQWSPTVMGVLGSPEEWQVLVLTKSACAIVDKTWYYARVGGDYEVCTEWRNKVLDYLDSINPEIVFVGSSTAYDFTAEDWVGGTSRILERLAPAARQVILLPGIPSLTFDGPSCLEDPWRFSFRLADGERECEEAQADDQSTVVAGYLRKAAAKYPDVHVLELGDLVCPDRRCGATTANGVAVFRDKSHVTASFARSIVPEVRARLDALGINLTRPVPGKQ